MRIATATSSPASPARRHELPQFGGSFGALLALGLAFSCLTLVWLTAYGVAVARAGDFLRRSRVRRALGAAVRIVLVALGLRVAGEAR